MPPGSDTGKRDSAALLAAARVWHAEDPDEQTRAELAELIERAEHPAGGPRSATAALAELADRFRGPLEFGTAGLRGALGAGPARMNRTVVQRAAAGLAGYLTATGGESVVIGYDARHRSAEFARDSADVLAGAGLTVHVLPRPLPTPVLAAAIRPLGCAAGVMVTASHNPAADNGYKVYLGDGAQLAPPVDADIAEHIAAVGPIASLPRSRAWQMLDGSVVEAYLDRVVRLPAAGQRSTRGSSNLRIAYTPLHGVGGQLACAALERSGFPSVAVVPEQADPDPDFPTVAFPNPEEPGALDRVLALARRERADLVLANDPDADRCAVAVPVGLDGQRHYRVLRGDEIGVLLGAQLLRRTPSGRFAASVVSSSLLARMAARHGVDYVETLTGFKWIARVEGLAYGYEEALGYCVDPDWVRDKDGIAAAVLVAGLAAELHAEGRSLLDLLDDLARAYDVHATDAVSLRLRDASEAAAAVARLRAAAPRELGGLRVDRVEDLLEGRSGLPPTDAMRYRLSGPGVAGARVIVRPSGTEPKLKAYLEVVVAAGSDLAAARTHAGSVLALIRADLAGLLVER